MGYPLTFQTDLRPAVFQPGRDHQVGRLAMHVQQTVHGADGSVSRIMSAGITSGIPPTAVLTTKRPQLQGRARRGRRSINRWWLQIRRSARQTSRVHFIHLAASTIAMQKASVKEQFRNTLPAAIASQSAEKAHHISMKVRMRVSGSNRMKQSNAASNPQRHTQRHA